MTNTFKIPDNCFRCQSKITHESILQVIGGEKVPKPWKCASCEYMWGTIDSYISFHVSENQVICIDYTDKHVAVYEHMYPLSKTIIMNLDSKCIKQYSLEEFLELAKNKSKRILNFK